MLHPAFPAKSYCSLYTVHTGSSAQTMSSGTLCPFHLSDIGHLLCFRAHCTQQLLYRTPNPSYRSTVSPISVPTCCSLLLVHRPPLPVDLWAPWAEMLARQSPDHFCTYSNTWNSMDTQYIFTKAILLHWSARKMENMLLRHLQ